MNFKERKRERVAYYFEAYPFPDKKTININE